MAQVAESLKPKWETQTEFLVTFFSLVLPQLWGKLRTQQWMGDSCACICLALYLAICCLSK